MEGDRLEPLLGAAFSPPAPLGTTPAREHSISPNTQPELYVLRQSLPAKNIS